MTAALGAVALLADSSSARKPRPASHPPAPAAPGARPASPTGEARSDRDTVEVVRLSGAWQRAYHLPAGRVVEISVHLERPSTLPPNARVAVEWTLARDKGSGGQQGNARPEPIPSSAPVGRKPDAFGIYTLPTADWRKTLHALDGDVYLVYRAPVSGRYTLRLKPLTEEEPVGSSPRWREAGHAPQLVPPPRRTPWPAGTVAPVAVSVRPVALGDAIEQERLRAVVECEPNDTPEQAQPLALTPGEGVRTWEITGGADDIEFFDNGRVGQSGDDWFRLDYKGREPRLLTAQLSLPGQVLAARIRVYRLEVEGRETGVGSGQTLQHPTSKIQNSSLLPIAEYFGKVNKSRPLFNENREVEVEEGRDPNERTHQQDEDHRANVCRLLQPGETYFLRVESNAPGYQLQLRLLRPAPYDDPRMAVRQAAYTHIGQVDSWLTNRPRGASLERRIRESGNLLGTNCMSCHTQSGVWGPSVPFQNGYRPENVQNYWHLINVMYECLRPTNQLKDAVNNTSLAPLDLGDGPAGTRAAGFNIVNLERLLKPRRLHSKMQIRTANYVLQTGDPGGINAAGPGSNVGQVVVYLFAGEILRTAWEKTGDPQYFRKLEEKAQRVLDVQPRFTDDIALRLDFFHRVFPIKDYPVWAERVQKAEPARSRSLDVAGFVERVKAQLAQDEARLRAIQNPDGSWGFNPGRSPDGGKTWQRGDSHFDPAPTALGITGLTSARYGRDDPAIAKAVKALLAMQEPTGRWNRAAITGFVTTSYALHALSRLYPAQPPVLRRTDFAPRPGETLLATVRRVQALALTGEAKFADLMLQAAQHDSPLVRYWALIGLGGTHTEAGVPVLIRALSDRVKMVRDAAVWALRQTLLDDRGWNAAFRAYETGGDYTREGVMQALNMRADAVMTNASLNWTRLGALLDRAMNRDPHPAVRAWAAKAAWQWWVWNPPIRPAVNAAWLKMLERPESSVLVENSNRYSSQMLFIANGHKANGSREHQYGELAALFEAITKRLDAPGDSETKRRLARRLVGIGATFFTMAGGDGGPGQMGYVTPGAGEMMGKAALLYLRQAVKGGDLTEIRIGLEGGSNVPYQPLTAFLVDYSLKGPEEVRQLAASAVSDPRAVSLPAVPEQVEPQMAQIRRGAMEPPRRAQVSDPIIDLWARVNWVVPRTEEQQRLFFDILIPTFDRYVAPEEIAALSDPARRAEVEREMSAAWYLADRLGEVLAVNPDLHQEIVFHRYFPAQFRNPLEERYWIRSVEWLLTFTPAMMQGGVKTASLLLAGQEPPPSQPDVTLTIKDRALQLYLDQLKPTANPQTRAIAIRMANQTALRTNPEVLRALSEALAFEKDEELRNIIANVLKQSNEKFLPELNAALKAERHPSVRLDAKGEPILTKAQTEDILYFRDYVMPELSRQKRSDQMSCIGCHGVPGRVPSMTLRAPDKFGYIPVADLLFNYRVLQQRVQLNDLERSKILRKPLNVQDGKEEGHQGGRRYNPTDEGYLILKKWVESQPIVQKPADATAEHPAPGAPVDAPRRSGLRAEPSPGRAARTGAEPRREPDIRLRVYLPIGRMISHHARVPTERRRPPRA